MELYGLALLPDEHTRAAVVAFQTRHSRHVTGPMLGVERNLPHLSILQCPYDPSTVTADTLRTLRGALPTGAAHATFTTFTHQPPGWLFANITAGRWLAGLHAAALAQTASAIRTDAIDRAADLAGHTASERRSYLRYGYRYVGADFRPHVTIGRCPPASPAAVPVPLARGYGHDLAGRGLTFAELVFYRAGEFGALAEVLLRTPLPPAAAG